MDGLFPVRLRECREALGLTQARLGEMAGLPASSISHFEIGSRLPSFENLGTLADWLGTSVDYLMGRTAGPPGAMVTDDRFLALVHAVERVTEALWSSDEVRAALTKARAGRAASRDRVVDVARQIDNDADRVDDSPVAEVATYLLDELHNALKERA